MAYCAARPTRGAVTRTTGESFAACASLRCEQGLVDCCKALLWKDDHLTPPKQEEDFIWNGGVTNNPASRIDDTNEDNTLVYDEYTIDGNIIYDGMMGEFNDDNE